MKSSAWIVTFIGVLLVLPLLGIAVTPLGRWLFALAVLVLGITKLMKEYK